MSNEIFYKIRKKGTEDCFSTGGQEPYWSKTGKTWNTLGHLKAHLQQVESMSSRTSGSYRYRYSNRTPADYGEADIVAFTTVEVSVQEAEAFIQILKDQKEEKKRKHIEAIQQEHEEQEKEELKRLQAKYPGV